MSDDGTFHAIGFISTRVSTVGNGFKQGRSWNAYSGDSGFTERFTNHHFT